jgi:uncharacterized damage-inducible protein DinB
MRVANTSYRSYYFSIDTKEPAMSLGKISPIRRVRTVLQQPHARLVAMKRWADLDLYETALCSVDRLGARDNFTMLRILDHMHVVDRIFQHHLQGSPHPFKAARSERMPELHALARGAREVDDWYAAYVGALGDDELDQPVDFVFTSGKPARMRRGEIILHVCLHGTYHRGNAGAVLQLNGLVPSREGFTNFLEGGG